MLHTRSEVGKPLKFSAGSRKLLKRLADDLWHAKSWEASANESRDEVRGALIDLFGVRDGPGSGAYQLEEGGKAAQVLCLDMGIHYEPIDDGAKLAQVLGDRLDLVLTSKPIFDVKKAEAAIVAGTVTQEELAQCVIAVMRPSAILRNAGDATTPKGIPPGEGRVKPLVLAKGLKLDWGERS